MRPDVEIDHRRRGDSYLRRHLIASAIVARGFTRAEYRDLPELRECVRIEGKDRVVLRNDKNQVVLVPRHRQV